MVIAEQRIIQNADAPPSAESVALANLIERHRSEYDFYVERAKADGVRDAADLPAFPKKLLNFSVLEFIAAALDIAVYEPDEEDESAIIASVPGAPGIFTCGHSPGEAVAYLIDLLESDLVWRLQDGLDIPPIPGVEVSEYEIGSQSEQIDLDEWERQLPEYDPDRWREEPPVASVKKIAEKLGFSAERRIPSKPQGR